MGGLLIVGVVAATTVLWAEMTNPYTLIALVVMLWMGALGFLDDYLKVAGFTSVERVKTHDLFDDSSTLEIGGVPISLNVVSTK